MDFDRQKRDILARDDKSKKGSVDEEILPLVETINKTKDYYTTSSCAGRILFIVRHDYKKNEAWWLIVTHSKMKFEDFKDIMDNPGEDDVWFKQEPPILHVACRDIEKAQILVNVARECGFKRSGIQGTKKRIIVEMASTEFIETIICSGNKLLVSEDYLKILVKYANDKLEHSRKKINKIKKELLKY